MKHLRRFGMTLLMLLFFLTAVRPNDVYADTNYITQTAATATSATIKWRKPSVSGKITGYTLIVDRKGYGYQGDNTEIELSASTYSYTITGLSQSCAYEIWVGCNYYVADDPDGPVTYCDFLDSDDGKDVMVYTTPGKITKLTQSDWLYNTLTATVEHNYDYDSDRRYTPEYYQYQLYNKSNKKVKEGLVSGSYSEALPITLPQRAKQYKIRIRAAQPISGTKIYGTWSPYCYLVQEAKVTSKSYSKSKRTLTIKWKKVEGATKYKIHIYAPASGKNDWWPYEIASATVKGTKTSYKLKKVKGKKLTSAAKKYVVHVETIKTKGGKTYSSSYSIMYDSSLW